LSHGEINHPPLMQTKRLPVAPDAVAPDGCNVRALLGVSGGTMAHFELGAGETSLAVRHRTVEEVWFFLSGRGQMWRSAGGEETTVEVGPGVSIDIPLGTTFQFRALGDAPLCAIGATMPPWPGDGEAVLTDGPWTPTVTPGAS
jgi:mannose-6-phosphate isomerase-like protein (cupin superfamily)